MDIKAASSAGDLGIDLSATSKRSNVKRNVRIKAADAKAKRIAKLHGAGVRAHMTKTVTMAQAIYGTEAVAVTPSQASNLKRKMTNMLGHKAGMCNASLLAIHEVEDPTAETRWRQVKEWIEVWLARLDLHGQIRTTWRQILSKMSSDDSAGNYKKALGPAGGMIALLLEIGFIPSEPDRWDTCRGRTWEMTSDPIDLVAFRKEFMAIFKAREWKIL